MRWFVYAVTIANIVGGVLAAGAGAVLLLECRPTKKNKPLSGPSLPHADP